jgi:uncharacterized RDD family membrane protein YckC
MFPSTAAALNKLLLALMLLVAATVRAADVTPHSLLAHANDQQFWVARIEHPPGNYPETTAVYYRLVGQDDKWQRLCFMQVRLERLASQGLLASALLSDGSWMLLYTDGSTVTGGPLPASAKMVALAGGKNWWAIGEVPGGLSAVEAATRPSASTSPATAPSATLPQNSSVRLVLFQLAGNDWQAVAQLPQEPIDGMRIELALFDDVPHVATFQKDVIDVRHLEGRRWVDDFHESGLSQTASFNLLGETGTPRLWVQQQSGPDLIYLLKGPNPQPLRLQPISDIPAKDRTVASFGGSIRMIGQSNAKFIEQRFAIDTGRPEGKPAELALPVSPVFDVQALQTVIFIGASLLVLLGWFRQQTSEDDEEKQRPEVVPAPIGRRLIAGFIDASPVILTMLVFFVRDRQYASAPIQSRQLMLLIAYWASGLFYILYMTLVESLGGRSLGKILFGLRVVTVEGLAPTPGAMAMRNVLRLFDVSLFFLPVIVVAFFPLRQRAGDLAAGTLVVLSSGTNENQKGDDQKSE